jgi:hypothetical protein
MPKKTDNDTFLTECEPYFLDGVHTIGQFATRTQDIVRNAVERHRESLIRALGFADDEVAVLDYWWPDKLQKAKPTDYIWIGVKLKVSDAFQAAIYRFWVAEDKATGVEVWTWIKGRKMLDQLCNALEDGDAFPEVTDAWEAYTGNDGSYFINRTLDQSAVSELGLRLDEFITYYINLLRSVGGIKKFLPSTPE